MTSTREAMDAGTREAIAEVHASPGLQTGLQAGVVRVAERCHGWALLLFGISIPVGEGLGFIALAAVAACLALRWRHVDLRVLREQPLRGFLSGLALWLAAGGVAIALSGQGWLKPGELGRWSPLLGVPLVVLSDASLPRRWLRRAAIGFVVALLIACVFGLVQYGLNVRPFEWLARIRSSLASQGRVPGEYGRAVAGGFYFHRLKMAHVLLTGIALFVGRQLFAELPWRRRMAEFGGGLLFGAALLLTFSRASVLGLAAAGLGCVALAPRRWRAAGLAAAVALSAAAWSVPSIRERISSIGGDQSQSPRVLVWSTAARIMADHPWGVGIGNFSDVVERYYDVVDPAFEVRTYPHNLLLAAWVEAGPVGAGAFLWAFAALLWAFVVGCRRRDATATVRGWAGSGVFLVVSFAVVGLTHDIFFHNAVALAFAAVAGGLLAAARPARELPARELPARELPAREPGCSSGGGAVSVPVSVSGSGSGSGRVALVHDWLVAHRGGEAVLLELARMFPGAPIYTLVHDPARTHPELLTHPIHTSFIQRLLPAPPRRFRALLPLFPRAIEAFDLTDFDLIISTSHCVAKGVRKRRPAQRHVSYVHTPMRYLWDQMPQYLPAGVAGRALAPLARWVALPLRHWDRRSAQRPDLLVANSAYVAARIERVWGRPAIVVHPPVATDYFAATDAFAATESRAEPPRAGLVTVGAFVPYKRTDLAVRLATQQQLALTVVGDGPEAARLRALAGPTVRFVRDLDRAALRALYARSAALIHGGAEDFGIAPVEAMAAGCPVIALRQGGLTETIVGEDGPAPTGVFFDEPTVTSLAAAVQRFELARRRGAFAPPVLRARAQLFDRQRFIDRMRAILF